MLFVAIIFSLLFLVFGLWQLLLFYFYLVTNVKFSNAGIRDVLGLSIGSELPVASNMKVILEAHGRKDYFHAESFEIHADFFLYAFYFFQTP